MGCRSRTEKLKYAVDVALKCGAALGDAWNCLQTLASPLDFMDCVKAVHSNAACKLLSYSSGRYSREWLGSGKNNYRFYGKCSEAGDKGGAKFTQHVMCPAP